SVSLVIGAETRFRSRIGAPLIRIADKHGKLHDFYGQGRILPEWVAHDPEQVMRYLDLGLIEPCDAGGRPTDTDRAIECLTALIACSVPEHAGRPRAADILRRNGLRYSNGTISKALRLLRSDWKLGEPVPWETGVPE
ncbi:MAG: hypothetical protein J2P17_22745, partial [Mycobacterium sp.]|nr:hypothetical protein [Mycobacterium sp.]